MNKIIQNNLKNHAHKKQNLLVKAVIFDMDGVIYNSMPMHLKIWKIIFNRRNIPFNLKIFEEYNGNSSKEISKKLVEKFNLNEKVEDIFKEKIKLELSMRDKIVDLFPEAITVLKELRNNNFKIAIATGALEHTVKYVKKRFRLDKYVDVFVESEDVKNGKPSPDIFLLAANKLNIEPKNCVVVEDATNGITAANKGNMISIAITTTFNKKVFVDADFIIDNLNELNKIIGE